jgi:hypothetical protein
MLGKLALTAASFGLSYDAVLRNADLRNADVRNPYAFKRLIKPEYRFRA